jgi:hypothetical protein
MHGRFVKRKLIVANRNRVDASQVQTLHRFRKDLNGTSNEALSHPTYARCGFELAANTVGEVCKQCRTV